MPFPHSSSRTLRHKLILAGIMVPLFMLVVIVLLVVLIPGRKEVPSSEMLLEWKGKGTTKHLREIILGRCYNYIATMNSELSDKDCLKIWELLENAFMYKNPCSMTEEDYQPLMDLARHSVPCNKLCLTVNQSCSYNPDPNIKRIHLCPNIKPKEWLKSLRGKSLFWSKTNDLVHRYTKANRDFITLEDTLLGYIADGITWCGNPSSPGVNYNSCPKWTECESNPSSIYWKMASKMFAEAACGTVQVMLNGSIEAGAFKSNSIFGNVEILNLNPDKVSRMHIWLMNDIDGPQSESCTGHSITKLKEILESRKISVHCEDNYRPVQLLQCTANPDHTTCRACS